MMNPTHRQLVPMVAAEIFLDRHEDAVLSLIESGELEWAWDISATSSRRREIRIWLGSIKSGLLHGLNQGRPGPKGYVRVRRQSILKFLHDRRVK